ncbi:Prefoldin subunit 6 [Holothuria leucospilota]|uniref:Prefoldin subunit 6 n=1 Tax=Holothuria leucospilota TaxID=206669 RepID=A0A9Q1HB71_HOLLE|nr:Prefoldin subunit 6 [Holothuria leucospilota]
MADALQKKFQEEVEKYQVAEKEFQKAVSARKQLDGQLNENNMVKEELLLLEADSKVYKMMGPVLVQQDLEEAKQNVNKRIEYISGEIKRHDSLIKELEKKQEDFREKLSKLQQDFQKAQAKQTGVAAKS